MDNNLDRLCIHTITTKPWDLEVALKKYNASGVTGISVWRNYLESRPIDESAKLLRESGLKVVSLVRGGFFTGIEIRDREFSVNENKRAIDEAAEIGAEMLVLVCGASPGQSLEKSRSQIKDALEKLLPYARDKKVKLAIEPLHPMYADTRSAINTMEQANNLTEYFDSKYMGVALDVYHTWWDPGLHDQIIRCGENYNLLAYHICDWRNPTRDLLKDRTVMGEGIIDIDQITKWVLETGYKGHFEVEIFSNEYWAIDQDDFLLKIISAYKRLNMDFDI